MTAAVKNPKEHRKTERKVRAAYKAMAVIAREQTAKLMKLAKSVFDGKAEASVLAPVYAGELKKAVKHAMVEAFKEGRREMKKKISLALKAAPAAVREMWNPAGRILAAVRELDADALKYAEVAAEYEKWAEAVIGGTLKKTIGKARDVIAGGVRDGVPWGDYGWDKELGKHTKSGLETQLSEVFKKYETYQLRRVAITEHTRAVGLGNVYEIDRDEMAAGGRWMVDYKGCDICTPRDGRVFTAAVLREIHPAHPNCQCTIDPVFEWEVKDGEMIEAAGDAPKPEAKAA